MNTIRRFLIRRPWSFRCGDRLIGRFNTREAAVTAAIHHLISDDGSVLCHGSHLPLDRLNPRINRILDRFAA